MTAEIRRAKLPNNSRELWLMIDGIEGNAWAIEDDEVEAIRDACNEYLEKKWVESQIKEVK